MGELEKTALKLVKTNSGVELAKTFGPQLVIPGPWKVQGVPHYMGSLDTTKLEAKLSMANTKLGKFIRVHELLHAKFSNDMTPNELMRYANVSLDTIRSSEDLRINQLGLRLDIDLECFGNTDGEQSLFRDVLRTMHKHLDNAQFREAALLWINLKPHVGGEGSSVDVELFNHLDRVHGNKTAKDFDTRCNTLINQATTFAVKQLETSEPARSKLNVMYSIELAILVDLLFSPNIVYEQTEKVQKINKLTKDLMQGPKRSNNTNRQRQFGQSAPKSTDTGLVRWGKMEVRKYPMALTTRKRFMDQKHKAMTEGTLLKAFYRVYTDGKMFLRRPKCPQPCNFLIDISGSMPWDSVNLVDLIYAVPKSLVMLYSGSGDTGVLHIIAKANLMVPKKKLESIILQAGAANVVDLPALEYLTLQRGVKYWVSDTMATCVSGPSKEARKQCSSFVQAKGIRVIDAEELQEAVELLKFKAKGKR